MTKVDKYDICPKKLYIVPEVVKILRLGPLTIRNHAKDGILLAYKEGRKGGYRILGASITKYMDSKYIKFQEEIKNKKMIKK